MQIEKTKARKHKLIGSYVTCYQILRNHGSETQTIMYQRYQCSLSHTQTRICLSHIKTSNKQQLKATIPLGAKGKLFHSPFVMPPVCQQPLLSEKRETFSWRSGAAWVARQLWEQRCRERLMWLADCGVMCM